MLNYIINTEDRIDNMKKSANKLKHILLLHDAFKHQSYRFSCESISADKLYEFLNQVHTAGIHLANEVHNATKRLKLTVYTTIYGDNDLAVETTHEFLKEEYKSALEDLLGYFEPYNVSYILSTPRNKPPKRYNVTLVAEVEADRTTSAS